MESETKPKQQCEAHSDFRDLPASGWSRAGRLFKRALLLQCPQCGSRGIFVHPWSIHDCCPTCGYKFTNEEGYFLGAYALNLLVAEIIGLGAVLVFLLRSDLSLLWQEILAITAAVLLPVIFYPWSRTLWMAFDLSTSGDKDHERVKPEHMGSGDS